jgi:outer membrane protein assembly factor BamB
MTRDFTMRLLVPYLVLIALGTARASSQENGNWPGFRGPSASGIQDGIPLAIEFDMETGENVLWTTPIPGLAHSSPIVWEDRVLVTTAVTEKEPFLRVGLYGESPDHPEEYDHEFKVLCLDRRTGKVIWDRTAIKGKPKVKRHVKASHANSTPATDGRHVVAFFGSEGLYCFDLEGKLLWKKDIGILDSGPYNAPDLQWGFASSPVLHDGKVIVQCDARNQAFLAAFDAATGRDLWRTDRDDVATWGTPTVATQEGSTQVLVNGWRHMGGYDLSTGKELWRLSGGGDVPVPTPVVSEGVAYITNAHGGMAPLYAVRLTARGDLTEKGEEKGLVWMDPRSGAYMQTPLVYRDLIYTCSDSGILKCYDKATGERVYQKRLGRGRNGFSASPVAGEGHLYFTSEEGEVFVVEAGREWDLLARNELGEICMATPAISRGAMFFRTRTELVSIGKGSPEGTRGE